MNNKKYEYIMNEREISEFCTKSFLEQFKTDKKTWIVLILVLFFLLLLSPRAAAALLVALALVYLMIFLQSHAAMKKALSGKQWAVGIELPQYSGKLFFCREILVKKNAYNMLEGSCIYFKI